MEEKPEKKQSQQEEEEETPKMETAEEQKKEIEETEKAEEPLMEETEEEIEKAEETLEEEKETIVGKAEKEKMEEKEALEEEIVEERIYTVPLQKAWIMPPKKRAPRAVRILRSFIEKHMKVGSRARKTEEEEEEAGELIISNEVNEKIWRRGIEKPPRKIRVRAVKDKEGVVTVYLAEGD